jgi:hypothetical protein
MKKVNTYTLYRSSACHSSCVWRKLANVN